MDFTIISGVIGDGMVAAIGYVLFRLERRIFVIEQIVRKHHEKALQDE